ncbi:MAG: GTPase Era [Rhodocyclales bacterium CG_4_9_14_3_um_filter_68_10]|nr:MAG: GTPase Era [Rhodocyclales bacterium CG_4_9_14_3_um_filter_68_10]
MGGHRAGSIAVVGRPNVGKSTLLNRLVRERISITSAKPQTTRHAIRGVLSTEDCQYVFIDTPGFQRQNRGALNRIMNRSIADSAAGVDLVFLVVEAGRFGAQDAAVLERLTGETPVILVVNKIDRVRPRENLLPFLDTVSRQGRFAEIVPVCAATGENLDELLRAAAAHLPEGDCLLPEDTLTDRSERFLAAEFIREKLFRRLGDELPYGLTVTIERFEEKERLRRIAAAIIVEKPGHKPIVIGRGGAALKQVATEARADMERLFGTKVFLEVWVKVRGGWSEDERALKALGY